MIPDDFGWKKYVKLNPDIASYVQNKKQAIDHYLQYGIRENRKYNKKWQHKIESIQKQHLPTYTNQEKIYSENKNILIVIVSCRKNIHLWNEIKSRTNNKMIILCGLNYEKNAYNLNTNTTHYNQDEQVLYLNCDDGYAGLPEKMVLAIEYILKNFQDITHILKIDDHDTYFTNENIQNLYKIGELDYYHYIGQKLCCFKEPGTSNWHFGKIFYDNPWNEKLGKIPAISYFDGGCTYILSKHAMEIINSVYNSNDIHQIRNNEIFEDAMIGKIMHNNNIKSALVNYFIKGDK